MGVIGKNFKYKVIKNFLSKDEIQLLFIYCEMKHRTNSTNFDFEMSNVADTRYYGDPLTDSLMLKKITQAIVYLAIVINYQLIYLE